MRFWLNMGIDGFRVDAIPYLFEREGTNCENLPETHAYLKRMRKMIDDEFPGRVLLAEACQLPHQVREYFGDSDEFQMGFHFPVMPRIYMSIKAANSTNLKEIMAETPEIPESCQWVTFLRNHDELTLEMVSKAERKWMWEQYAPDARMRINLGIRRRLAPLMDNDRRKIELAHSMLLTLPGSPILYYGDEINMGDDIELSDRNGVRTPMQWDSTLPHAGFSTAERTYAPVIKSASYGPHRVNVRDAERDPSSFYHILRFMIGQRRKHSAFGFGNFQWLECGDVSLACWIRSYGVDTVCVVHNLSADHKQARIELNMSSQQQDSPLSSCCQDILTGARFPIESDGSVRLSLEPYQFYWLDCSTWYLHGF
eukprot:TRINITY_DN1695_c0_g1_i1.p1 TRINITY_DN1695_c0_g1~~TRINITY_DN1695_c0_g1_i1.p1  ORF type:complete len:369 (-),score=113.60 TRINITY_DN1695_c0_g1_i1:83-1189(-)